jgi:hypothetical protein
MQGPPSHRLMQGPHSHRLVQGLPPTVWWRPALVLPGGTGPARLTLLSI